MSRSDRDRDERGQYAETVTPGDVLAVFQDGEDPCEPLTAREVADVLDCDRKTAYNKLTALSDRDSPALKTKKIGARGRVWWHSPPVDELANQVGARRVEDIAASGVSDDRGTSEKEGSRRESTRDGVEFPVGRDRDECLAAVDAVCDYLRDHGPASMREIVTGVMPKHPVGYDVPDLEPGDRYRGAWWRKVVKPGLEARSDVAKPSGGGKWRYVGES